MAFTSSAQADVRSTGSDTQAGFFDPGVAGFATDGAATSATGSSPVFTSASYTFVAGDVGAWVYIKSGTNWISGWYSIASVSSGAATLSAAVGAVNIGSGLNTTAGCASVASPTGATWGIDYSQQDSAKISFTDMVIDATTNTKFTSSANPVGQNFVGNGISVNSGTGWTVQRVIVVSISGTVATCDKALGTVSSTGGTGKLGGGLLTLPTAVIPAASGNTIHFKYSTYTYTSQQVLSPSTANTTISITGYTTTHNDGAPTRPLITTATNSVDLIGFSNTRNTWILKWTGINISSTAGTPGIGFAGVSGVNTGFIAADTVISGFSQGINFGGVNRGTYWNVNLVNLYNVEIKSCTSHGIALFGSNTFPMLFVGNNIHNNTGAGVFYNGGTGDGMVFLRNLITTNGAIGINLATTTPLYLSQNTIANNTGDGVIIPTSASNPISLENNVFYGNSGWGFNAASSIFLLWNHNNGYGGNTSGDRNNLTAASNDVTLTASPFTSSSDFSLNSTAGGGAALKAAGFPGVFSGGTTTGYLDVGAVQSQASSGSSGGGNYCFVG